VTSETEPISSVPRCCEAHAVANLVYTYAERIDAGDFEGVAELFNHAIITFEEVPGREVKGRDEALEMYTSFTRRYEDNGTPHTRHVTTNLLIEVDDGGEQATCRSYFTVLQRTEGFPLQPILAGRYHDEFEKVTGEWRFVRRHMFNDYVGDVSQHLLVPLIS
jgi:ketosteroid isomerase-like protein